MLNSLVEFFTDEVNLLIFKMQFCINLMLVGILLITSSILELSHAPEYIQMVIYFLIFVGFKIFIEDKIFDYLDD